MCIRDRVQICGNFWSLPNPVEWSNYSMAFTSLFPNMINSLIVVVVGVVGAVLLAANSGYVFAKLNFPGKNVLFMFIMALMMIPGCLTLTPQFTLIQDLGLKNSWFALWLPWIAGGQVFGIILCRTFMSAIPTEIFESARIDGCGEPVSYTHLDVYKRQILRRPRMACRAAVGSFPASLRRAF